MLEVIAANIISQCAIPVFDGLLPEPDNNNILRLLFIFAHWHGLAKLRMHSDTTLDIMDDVTTDMGRALRHFKKKTCPKYKTKELPREASARQRRQQKTGGMQAKAATGQPVHKTFNNNTYKYHSLGDYVRMIRRFGTTDSYSTTPVSPSHPRFSDLFSKHLTKTFDTGRT